MSWRFVRLEDRLDSDNVALTSVGAGFGSASSSRMNSTSGANIARCSDVVDVGLVTSQVPRLSEPVDRCLQAVLHAVLVSVLRLPAEFAAELARADVFVLPGSTVNLPGWFRISLTGSDSMIDASVERFRRARELAPA